MSSETSRRAFALLFGLSLWCSGCLIWDNNRDGVIRVAAIGDSNTVSKDDNPSWCDRLKTAHPSIDFRCHGQNGARMIGTFWYSAGTLLDVVLAEQPDVVMLAFGTNDMLLDGATPQQIFDALIALTARIEATGAIAVSALIPPVPTTSATMQANIITYNEVVTDRFTATRSIDFYTDMADLLMDGVHFNAAGQQLRADRAAAVLWAP